MNGNRANRAALRAVGLDALFRQRFTAVVLLLGFAAYFQVSGLNQLVATSSATRSTPSAGIERMTVIIDRKGEPMSIELNIR